jgi:hypothetical protein
MLQFSCYNLCITTFIGYSKRDPCRNLSLLTKVGGIINLILMSRKVIEHYLWFVPTVKV